MTLSSNKFILLHRIFKEVRFVVGFGEIMEHKLTILLHRIFKEVSFVARFCEMMEHKLTIFFPRKIPITVMMSSNWDDSCVNKEYPYFCIISRKIQCGGDNSKPSSKMRTTPLYTSEY
jgi:hypothetical protein